MTSINNELVNERKKNSFKVEELTDFFYGGADKTLARRQRSRAIFKEAKLIEGVPFEYLSHKEKFEEVVRQTSILYKIRKLQNMPIDLAKYKDFTYNEIFSAYQFRDGSPLASHYIVFIPALLSQASEEQCAYWLPKAWEGEVIGSYAQTELGHGTNIRALETTATYDSDTQEFILNSPSRTAYKWWPGGLGHFANHCIVIAQLYTKGTCHGIHAFLVQIRDENTHYPFPGIDVGDIGPKLGINAINNGYLGFDNYRIPKRNMLMKYAQVLEDGTYVMSGNPKLIYGSMVFVRVILVFDAASLISRAVTIATRYSAVRRQTQLQPDEPERQIIDYLTQQHKLFIGIAAAHAYHITAQKLWNVFEIVNEEFNGGNFDRLSEIHALSCCLKAVSSAESAFHVEQCRLACGGNGFLLSSNLPNLYAITTASCIYEGDNTVLLLQTVRFLLKMWQNVQNGKLLAPTLAYFKNYENNEANIKWQNTVDHIIKAFQLVSVRKIALCTEVMQNRVAAGASLEDAWNLTSIQLVAAAEAYCRLIILSFFNEGIERASNKLSPELLQVMTQLVELYSVYWALQNIADLLKYTCISENNVVELQTWYEELLCTLRPNAVSLVDAFDFNDCMLNSTLGAYDGRVYERLMEETKKNPLNSEPVNKSFEKYLKPLLKGKL